MSGWGNVAEVLPAACAIEMIHKMTLVHDDLPAMDNAATRDGRPALHCVYGEAMAILAGDTLLVHAFEQLASARDAPSERSLSVISRLCRALGTAGVAGGQALDLLAQRELLSPETLEDVHMRKTGALFEAAIGIGAEVGGASPAQMEHSPAMECCSAGPSRSPMTSTTARPRTRHRGTASRRTTSRCMDKKGPSASCSNWWSRRFPQSRRSTGGTSGHWPGLRLSSFSAP
ncbi:polyprenyl synthetase family protein [Cystobacter fuscus]